MFSSDIKPSSELSTGNSEGIYKLPEATNFNMPARTDGLLITFRLSCGAHDVADIEGLCFDNVTLI